MTTPLTRHVSLALFLLIIAVSTAAAAENHAPLAVPGGPYAADLDGSVTLNATGSSDPDAATGDTIVAYAWDLDADGAFDDASGATPVLTAAILSSLGVGSHPIGLRVTDTFGLSAVAWTTLAVYDNRPVARFTAVPNPAACSQAVTFDARGSSAGRPDRQIVSYAWTFGDATTGTGQQASHNFAAFGTYTVTLTVTDNNVPPKTATATTVVSVNQGNLAPVPAPGGPYTVDLGSGVALNGSGSSEPNAACGDSIVSYAWSLAGGAIGATEATPTLTAAQIQSLGPGTHPVSLTVTDAFGLSATASTTLAIYSNQPTARFTAVPSPAACGQAVAFDASGSFHGRPDRQIVSYAWDFGDGSPGTGPQASHGFAAFGTYAVTLTVTDDNVPAKTATATTVVDANQGNLAPIAAPGGPYTADLGSGLTLAGGGSSEPNAACGDSIVSYAWSLAGGAISATGATPTLTAAQIQDLGPGTHPVSLTVTDAFGLSATASTTLAIYTNRPTAAFTAVPSPAACGQTVAFDASGSSHGRPDRQLVSYAWDFGDGRPGTGQQASHSFAAFGTYTVTLTVTDDNVPPRTATATTVVDVNQGNLAPVPAPGGPYTVEAGSGVTLDGRDSSDPNTSCGDAIVSHRWSFAGGTIVVTGATVTLSAEQLAPLPPGTYPVVLTVTDRFGAAGTASTTLVRVADRTPPVLSLPAEVTLKATSPDGAVVTYTASATDNSDPSPVVSCAPASGQTFPIGTTEVTCTAADAAGNSARGNFPVTVTGEPPVASAGPDQSVTRGTEVSLDGSGSYDPDRDYPLSYAWQITVAPAGSTVALVGADTPNPSLTPDLPGAYVIGLTVTDAIGLTSAPDEVIVSTLNTAPVAAAGPDQSVTTVGTLVQLDGSASYDVDGDPLSYHWTIVTWPDGSTATLSDPTGAHPTFVMDVYGDYVIGLVVTDAFGDASEQDLVTISSTNVPPVADAGGNQAVTVGATVSLDGSLSHDANGDSLTYAWSLVSTPAGSTASLSTPALVTTSFVADVPGDYVVSLVVSDGFVAGAPSNVIVTAISLDTAAGLVLAEAANHINRLAPDAVRNPNLRHALTQKINAVLTLIDEGQYADAVSKLKHDILAKTDGCAAGGAPDRNDWILDCAVQREVVGLILRTIELLGGLF